MNTRLAKRALAGLLMVAMGLALGACGSEYPADNLWGSVSGRFFYEGEAHLDLKVPGVGVFMFTHWPPEAMPHAGTLAVEPEFIPEGIPYEVTVLEPFEYIVLAFMLDLSEPISFVIDLENPEFLPAALGAYPDLATFVTDRVEVHAGETTMDIDIILFDL